MWKGSIKWFIGTHFPVLAEAYRSINNRRLFKKRFRPMQDEVARALFPDGTIKVMSGPFAGMRYLNEVVWGPITPKWIGCYEAELIPVIQEIARAEYETILDVGCAEGYYACGLALLLPGSKVYAFDTDFISRKQAGKLAALNGVHVEVRGVCSTKAIGDLLRGRSLLVCDIEGSERELLDPGRCPGLRRYDILSEIHERDDSIAELIRGRFEESHSIAEFRAVDRSDWLVQHGGCLGQLSESLRDQAVQEHRIDGRLWFWMKRREG